MYVSAGNPNVLHDRIIGHTDGSNAPAGEIGEYQSITNAGGTGLASGSTSLVVGPLATLTAGDWDLSGAITFQFAATTSYTYLTAGFSWNIGNPPVGQILALPALLPDSQTSQTQASLNITFFDLQNFKFGTPAEVPGTANPMTFTLPNCRLVIPNSASVPISIGIVAQAIFTVAALSAGGTLRARRVR